MCQFITTYLLLCTSCSCLRLSSIDHIWRKILISAATVCSQDLKKATMLLVVYFIPFLLFCQQTGQYLVRITERTLYYPPIFYLRRVQMPSSQELFSKNQIPGSQKFLTNFLEIARLIPLRTQDICLEISNDCKYCLGLKVEPTVKRGQKIFKF